MSDSELSDAPAIPSDAELEKSLRATVIKAQKAGEEVTVNDIRKRSARALGLDEAFFSTDTQWKGKSKEIIKTQFDNDNGEIQEASPKPKPKPKLTKKRPSPGPSQQPRKKAKSAKNDTPNSPEPVKASKDEPSARQNLASAVKDDDSGSDLSSLVDDDPAPKKSRAKSADTTSKAAKANQSKSKDKPSLDTDPEAEEIKRLQSWLSKCGIRKVWGAYLKPYPSSKDKIKHLKQMLTDVGMTGRYSNEKASQIKEARELAADIEAVQEGNERWGKDGEDDDEDGHDQNEMDRSKSGRKLIRGAKHFDFLSSDGEETD